MNSATKQAQREKEIQGAMRREKENMLAQRAASAAKIRVYFDDLPFVRSHLKQPRGRGSWAFSSDPRCDSALCVFAPSNLTLTEAKRWMRDNIAKLYPVPGIKFAIVFVAP